MHRTSLLFAGVLAAGLGWFNYASMTEAFGNGAPYYSRTTNMDKWVNPLPILIPLDLAAFAAGYLLLRKRRTSR